MDIKVQFEEVVNVFAVILLFNEVKYMTSLTDHNIRIYFVFVNNINRMFVTELQEIMFKLFMLIPL